MNIGPSTAVWLTPTSLKKTDPPSLEAISSSSAEGRGSWAHLGLCWDADWLDLAQVLYRQPQQLWVHGDSEDAVLAQPSSTSASYNLIILSSVTVPEFGVGGVRYKHPNYRWAFHWHLFSAFWPLITPFKGQPIGWMHKTIIINLHERFRIYEDTTVDFLYIYIHTNIHTYIKMMRIEV